MVFVISIVMSVLLIVMQMLRNPEHSVYFKKFTWKKQQIVSILLGAIFLIAILAVGICFPKYETVCSLLCVVQLCVNVGYISILNIVGTKRFRQHVIDEIIRLKIDITEEPIVIRRKLAESSENSYSIKDIEFAIDTIEKANRDKRNDKLK